MNHRIAVSLAALSAIALVGSAQDELPPGPPDGMGAPPPLHMRGDFPPPPPDDATTSSIGPGRRMGLPPHGQKMGRCDDRMSSEPASRPPHHGPPRDAGGPPPPPPPPDGDEMGPPPEGMPDGPPPPPRPPDNDTEPAP